MSRMYVGRFICQINQQAAALKAEGTVYMGVWTMPSPQQEDRMYVLLFCSERLKSQKEFHSIFEESCRMMRKYLRCLTIYVCQEDRKREVSSLTYTTSHCKKALSEPGDICAILELWSLFLHRSLPNCWSKENSCHLRMTHTR